jgi:MFS family permease
MGMAQPFLAAFMHLDAGQRNPYRGIGLYSVALGVGLVLGPLVPYGLLIVGGYIAVFLTLSVLAAVGLAEVIAHNFYRDSFSPEKIEYSFSLTKWITAFKNKAFSQAFSVNFLYSLLLPIILSYGGVYAEKRFGITSSTALLVFTAIFLMSTLVRVSTVGLGQKNHHFSLLISGAFLAGSFLAIGTAPSFSVYLLGMLAFSVPHAFIFPTTNYMALSAVENDTVMNASYAFQASSGVAEFISPTIAVALISLYGISSIFVAMAPIAVLVLCIMVLSYLRK